MKRVLLGVTGGIAAYKSVEILRLLQQSGVQVDVLMTRSARRFLAPLTFSALTGRPVYTSLWAPAAPASPENPIEHIALAQSIDALLIAPATASTLARLAHGYSPDLLSTIYLATSAPFIVAPAMNVCMWQHPATVANVMTLQSRGAHIVSPEAGHLACGMTGPGRLADPDAIVAAVLRTLQGRLDASSSSKAETRDDQRSLLAQDFQGLTVLVTAGGTREALDPVRYLGNRSSGRMGYALAAAAQARGASVVLITASNLPIPPGVQPVHVETAEEMGRALQRHLPDADLLCAAAAVADFRPVISSPTKIRRQGTLTLTLEPTPDLLAQAAASRKPGTLIIGFAAEAGDLERNGRAKLLRKGADAILANDISTPGLGFDAEDNAGLFLTPDRTVVLPRMPKRAMADRILDEAQALRAAAGTAPEAEAAAAGRN